MERVEVLPPPDESPTGCVIQLLIKLTGYSSPILAVCDGGAEVASKSKGVWTAEPTDVASSHQWEGQGSLNHSPLGTCKVKVEILELAVAIHYDLIVEDIEEDFLIDVKCPSSSAIWHSRTVQNRKSCERSCQNQERKVQGMNNYPSVRLANSMWVQADGCSTS